MLGLAAFILHQSIVTLDCFGKYNNKQRHIMQNPP